MKKQLRLSLLTSLIIFTVSAGPWEDFMRTARMRGVRRNQTAENAIALGACVVGASYLTYKAGCSFYDWYARGYAIPSLIEEAQAFSSNDQRPCLVAKNTILPVLQAIDNGAYHVEEALEIFYTNRQLFTSQTHQQVDELSKRLIRSLTTHQQQSRLTPEHISVLDAVVAQREQIVEIDRLAQQLMTRHKSYFNARDTIAQVWQLTGAIPYPLVKLHDYDVTAQGIRQCFGYDIANNHYLVDAARRFEEPLDKLRNIRIWSELVRVDSQIRSMIAYLSEMQSTILHLPEFPQHVAAENQLKQQEEQRRQEQERLSFERQRAETERLALFAQQMQLRTQNQLAEERNRIERERLELEKKNSQQPGRLGSAQNNVRK